MKFRRYCVTVMDNWTPTREFWTLTGAIKHWRAHGASHLFIWVEGVWKELSYPNTKDRLRTWPK